MKTALHQVVCLISLLMICPINVVGGILKLKVAGNCFGRAEEQCPT